MQAPRYRMVLALTAVALLFPVAAQERDVPWMSAYIATRLVENGKPDNDRLYLFSFSYSDLDPSACNVQSIVIHNLRCSNSPHAAPLAKPGTSAVAGGGRLNVYDAIKSSVVHAATFRARKG